MHIKQDTHIVAGIEEYLRGIYGEQFNFRKLTITREPSGTAVVTIEPELRVVPQRIKPTIAWAA